MKIIEGLKQLKDLQRKAEELRQKAGQHSAHLDYETPVYADQKGQVATWVQMHSDVLKEILRLKLAIQVTNLTVLVPIEFEGKTVTKPIAAWIIRRRELAHMEALMWKGLTDRGLKEGKGMNSMQQQIEVKIIRCYDPKERDETLMALGSEPSLIDAKLEIVNATTDLIES